MDVMLIGSVGLVMMFFVAVAFYYFLSHRPKRLYRIALQNMNYGNYSRAVDLLEILYRSYPAHIQGIWKLANLYFDGEDYPRARKLLKKLLTHKLDTVPTIYEVRHRLAQANRRLDRYKEALEEYGILIKIAPEKQKTDFYFERGMMYYRMDSWEKAYHDFTEVIRVRPQFADGFYYRGMTLLALGRRSEAQKSFQRAVDIKKDYAPALLELGRLMQKDDEPRAAAEIFQQIIDGEGTPKAAAAVALAQSLCQMDEPLRAVRILERVMLEETDEEVRAAMKYEMALGYDQMGEKSKAKACMREVYQVSPELPGVREYLGDDIAILRDEDLVTYFMELHVTEFEKQAYALVELYGFEVLQAHVHSFESIDVIAERPQEIYNEKAVFNFRRWTHLIAELPIRELHRQVMEERAHRGYFVAPALFTAAAMQEAAERRIELIGRDKLVPHLRETGRLLAT